VFFLSFFGFFWRPPVTACPRVTSLLQCTCQTKKPLIHKQLQNNPRNSCSNNPSIARKYCTLRNRPPIASPKCFLSNAYIDTGHFSPNRQSPIDNRKFPVTFSSFPATHAAI
jgi:hypothetical protein